jgi:hypothetical protein
MDVRRNLRSVGKAAALVGLIVAAFAIGAIVRGALGTTPDVVFAEDGAAVSVTNRLATIDGAAVGEVLIGEEVVMRLRATLGGLTPDERAMVVASRLLGWANASDRYELSVLEIDDGMAVINAGENSITTVGIGDAEPISTTPLDLANDWRNNILIALGEAPQPADEVADATAPADDTGEWVPEEPYRDKIVPIISVLEGIRIGAARVSGPESKVRTVKAVAQLETDFRRFLEIDVYVPITTEKPGKTIDRVQGVGVTALGDLRL